MKLFKSAFLIVALLGTYSSSSIANSSPWVKSPSFDCSKSSTSVEKAICSDMELAGLDIWMAEVYKIALKSTDPNKLKLEQLEWLSKRSGCLSEPGAVSGSSGLAECYYHRIKQLIAEHHIDIDSTFKKNLARKMGATIPTQFENKGEEFVFFQNLDYWIDLESFRTYHCDYNPPILLYYASPILITTVNGSTVCGGTSSTVSSKREYCEKDGKFYEGSVWVCKPERLLDKDFLLGYLATHSFSHFSNTFSPDPQKNIFISYLYSFPIHSLAEPSELPVNSRMFSDEYIELLQNNLEIFFAMTKAHRPAFKDVVLGMDCALNMVKSTTNWEEIFLRNHPWWIGSNWYGQQFSGCETYDTRIYGERYTYKELYVELWRRLYFAGGMSRAAQVLHEIKTALRD